MVFDFSHPLLLLLIPAAVVFVLFTSKSMVKLVKWRRKTILSLRLCIFTLLILCIAGFGLKTYSNSTTNIFLVDGSDSMSMSKAKASEFIKDAIKSKKSGDKVGVVTFGANSAVDLLPSEKPLFEEVQTKINGNFTNIEQALKLTQSLIPSGDRKRVILVSDGMENDGNALKEARLLKQQDITLDVFPVESPLTSEVQVKEVTIPDALRMNEKFEVAVKVNSTVKTRANLKLYAERELAAERTVEIQEGENNFVFSDKAAKGGMITYTAVLEPEKDTITANNTISTFSYVEDASRVLVVQDKDEGASELVKILEKDVRLDVSSPDSVPLALSELQKYDAFILSNVSAERLNDRFLDNLELCIKHQGKGLLVTGGENSYAPGGYYKTALERVLPVNMDIKPKEEQPNLGLVLVVDKSGSMSSGEYGISKLELAKEAAIRSVEALKSKDMIGVIAFDDAVQWVVRTQKLDDVQSIQNSIGTIRPGGGTQILHPLEEAYLSLKNASAKLKHIILLTDGQAERSGYEPVIEGINEAGITLSTVAVGEGADTALLRALAIGGNGRYYATDAFSDIPKIFVKETFLAGKTYLNNRTFYPGLSATSDVLKNIASVPSLDGYVGTTPKSTARVIFSSDTEDPVLATWQYGLGRTAAWTSDAKGMWTSEWLKWDQSSTFWKNLLSWLIQKKSDQQYSLKGSMAGGTGSIELTLPPDERLENEKAAAVMISPSGKEQSIELSPVSPGIYRGSFNAEETGVYLANIQISGGSEISKSISTGINIPYSPEYDIPQKDAPAFLERLAFEGGGRIIKDSRDVFSGQLKPTISMTDLTPFLLSLLILLFMLDIAVRRLNISFEWVRPMAGKITAAGSRVYIPVIKALSTVRKPAVQPAKPSFVENPADSKDTPPSASEVKADVVKDTGGKKREPEVEKSNSTHLDLLLEKKKKRNQS